MTISEATRILVSYTSYEIPFTCGQQKMSNEADTALLNFETFLQLGYVIFPVKSSEKLWGYKI